MKIFNIKAVTPEETIEEEICVVKDDAVDRLVEIMEDCQGALDCEDEATIEQFDEAILAIREFDEDEDVAITQLIPGGYQFTLEADERPAAAPAEALATYLDCSVSDAEWDIDRDNYKVLTDDEADEAAAEYIKQALWAFNADFLAGETRLPSEVFEALSEKCESANEALAAIIEQTCGMKDFVETAVGCDGRGHFMNSYDGDENECEGYYIYRIR